MTIATYTELRSAVASYMHRESDAGFTALVPDFIRLFEARANRLLRVRAMETTLAETALVAGAVTLPSGFLAFEELRGVADPSYTLEPKPLEWIRAQSSNSGKPLYFALTGNTALCWPTAGSVTGTYYAEIPPLASNATNWLLTSHPDVYLFGALEEAAIYTQDTGSMQLWANKTASLMDHLTSADIGNQLNGGPLTARAR